MYEDQKIYKIYFKDYLYAWTCDKKLRDLFLYQRNKSLFIVKKQRLNEAVFKAFSYKYKDQMIIEIPVSSKGITHIICGTYSEDQQLVSFSEKILGEFEEMNIFFNHLDQLDVVPKKYMKAIWTLLTYQHISKINNDNIFDVDSLLMFYDLFKNTF